MAIIETTAEAEKLNKNGKYGPYLAANGHTMVAPLYWPKDQDGNERDYELGDEIRYSSAYAECSDTCNHTYPPEDW